MLLSNYQDWIRASKAEAFLFKEKEMTVDSFGRLDSDTRPRRLSIGPDGTISGKFPGVFSSKAQAENKQAMQPSDDTLKIWEALSQSVVQNGVTPTPPIAATAESVNQIQTQAQIQSMLTYTPLTAQQRITELNKKIAEYRALLEIVQDATIKVLLVKMFQNIEKELSEISYQVAQIPTQKPENWPNIQPVVKPWNPMYPIGPVSPYTLGPGGEPDAVMFTAQDAVKRTPDPGYTICAGKTCVEIPTDGFTGFMTNFDDGK